MARYIVFECRKCEHKLYVENTGNIFNKIARASNLECPNCGEEPEGNWALLGLREESPHSKKWGE